MDDKEKLLDCKYLAFIPCFVIVTPLTGSGRLEIRRHGDRPHLSVGFCPGVHPGNRRPFPPASSTWGRHMNEYLLCLYFFLTIQTVRMHRFSGHFKRQDTNVTTSVISHMKPKGFGIGLRREKQKLNGGKNIRL